jgi:hypothetical protein
VTNPLARLLTAPDPNRGRPMVTGGYLTTWDGLTYANTVSAGGATWTNVAVLTPTALSIGPVLLLWTDAGPVVIGRIYRAT